MLIYELKCEMKNSFGKMLQFKRNKRIMLHGLWETLFLSLPGNGFLARSQFLCFLVVTFSAWLTPFSGRKNSWDGQKQQH